jgi:hypothetical protein
MMVICVLQCAVKHPLDPFNVVGWNGVPSDRASARYVQLAAAEVQADRAIDDLQLMGAA